MYFFKYMQNSLKYERKETFLLYPFHESFLLQKVVVHQRFHACVDLCEADKSKRHFKFNNPMPIDSNTKTLNKISG